MVECATMKRFALVASVVLIGCGSGQSVSSAPVGPGASATPVPEGWRVVLDMDAPPSLPTIAEHSNVLDGLVGAHADDRSQCKPGGPKLIATLQGGITGAFTGPGKKETAYLVTTRGCDDPVEKDTDKHRFVVMADGVLVIDQEVTEHALVAVNDLDADGDNEVVLVSGHRDDPTGSVSAKLVDTGGGQFEAIYDFGEVARTRCGGGKGTLSSSRILYRVKGSSMEYRNERRERPCPVK